MAFQKGHIPYINHYWLGKHLSEETKEKLRIAKLGKSNKKCSDTKKHLYAEGKLIPWNKGKVGLQVAWNKGLHITHIGTFKKGHKTNVGRTGWTKGLTKDDLRVFKATRHAVGNKYGCKNKGHSYSQDYKDRMREIVKERYRLNPEKHPNRILAKMGRLSKPQLRLLEILKKKYPDAEPNLFIKEARKFVDIGIPTLKIAYEYDEPYWHQDKQKDYQRKQLIEYAGWEVISLTNQTQVEALK